MFPDTSFDIQTPDPWLNARNVFDYGETGAHSFTGALSNFHLQQESNYDWLDAFNLTENLLPNSAELSSRVLDITHTEGSYSLTPLQDHNIETVSFANTANDGYRDPVNTCLPSTPGTSIETMAEHCALFPSVFQDCVISTDRQSKSPRSNETPDPLKFIEESRRTCEAANLTENTTNHRYDTCFGVVSYKWSDEWSSTFLLTLLQLVTSISSSLNEGLGPKQAPVDLSPSFNMLRISFQKSHKYAGLLNSPTLAALVKDKRVKLDAMLSARKKVYNPSSKKNKALKSTELRYSVPAEHDLRIVVYGLSTDRVALGNLLSDAGLYLQHPSTTEYERSLEYVNPHYLLRPGDQMPSLEHLSTSDRDASSQSEILDEVHTNRVMRIFDLVDDVQSLTTVTPSQRLRSTLDQYEFTSVTGSCRITVLILTGIN